MIANREINRLRYLQAMGVQTLVAHRPLPGAAPSRRLCLWTGLATGLTTGLASAGSTQPSDGLATPEPTAAGNAKPTSASTPGAASIGAHTQSLRQALDDPSVPKDPSGDDALTRSGCPPLARGESRDAERFSVAVLAAAGHLWVEDLGDSALAREQVDLVAAMARALTHPQAPEGRPKLAQFDWPMHGNVQLDLSAREALASLASFLERQLQERECRAIVCLGAAASARLAQLSMACPRVDLPATRELLAEPGLKRDAWVRLSV